MKKNKTISILLILVLLFSTASISVSAADSGSHSHEILSSEKSFIFEDGTSSEIKKRIIMDLSGNVKTPNSIKGLTCILFGHKLETGTLITITHRVRATSPVAYGKHMIMKYAHDVAIVSIRVYPQCTSFAAVN